MTTTKSSLYPIPLLIATLLAAHGLRKGSLSFSGAIAAFLVGYFHLACPLNFFGVSLIAFYLLGSRATKIKVKEKEKLEDGVDLVKSGGNRDAVQVRDLQHSNQTLVPVWQYDKTGQDKPNQDGMHKTTRETIVERRDC